MNFDKWARQLADEMSKVVEKEDTLQSKPGDTSDIGSDGPIKHDPTKVKVSWGGIEFEGFYEDSIRISSQEDLNKICEEGIQPNKNYIVEPGFYKIVKPPIPTAISWELHIKDVDGNDVVESGKSDSTKEWAFDYDAGKPWQDHVHIGKVNSNTITGIHKDNGPIQVLKIPDKLCENPYWYEDSLRLYPKEDRKQMYEGSWNDEEEEISQPEEGSYAPLYTKCIINVNSLAEFLVLGFKCGIQYKTTMLSEYEVAVERIN